MWRAFLNILKVKELRNRLMFTALIIVLVRVASNIPCPGVDPAALERFIKEVTNASGADGGFMALIDLFSGGALAHFALGALGIMPYISASIILQLMIPVIPQLVSDDYRLFDPGCHGGYGDGQSDKNRIAQSF